MSLLWLAKDDYIINREVVHATVKNPNWVKIGYNNCCGCWFEYIDWISSLTQTLHKAHNNVLCREEIFI